MKSFAAACLSLLLSTCTFAAGINSKQKASIEKKYRFADTMQVDGRTRTFLVNLPPNYYVSDSFSLVIALHGGGGNGSQFERTSRLTEKANSAKFIVVYPEGIQGNGILRARSWNAGDCCAAAVDRNIDDVKFISLLIDKLLAAYKISPKKVYAAGHSNGGMLAYRLACELSGKIAAIVASSCTMVNSSPCNPPRPVPILHMQAAGDTKVPYKGGMGSGITGVYFPPIDSVLNVWSAVNACSVPAKLVINNSQYKLTKWYGCNNRVTIQYYLLLDGGHGWPGGLPGGLKGDIPSTAINANDVLWDFFQQYQLP